MQPYTAKVREPLTRLLVPLLTEAQILFPFFFLSAPVNSPLSQRGTFMGSRDFIYSFFLSSALMQGFHPVPPVLALALCVCVQWQ